ncbi:MAG: hypothetical protein KGJ05_02655, partial [Alphaproteobacteria bacterium]|nr:hypothetical protein [Alphaproteobacteria bacterium]
QSTPQNYGPTAQQGNILTEDNAVNACASAAEQQGGQFASVREIRDVHAQANGWDVKGSIQQRYSYRDAGITNSFKCQVRYGAVQWVHINNQGATLK